MDMRRLVGINVKRLRLGKGLTQEQYAVKSGLAQQYVSDLENGKKNPTLTTLHQIAEGLGVEVVELVQKPPAANRNR